MKPFQMARLYGVLLGMLLLWSAPACAQRVMSGQLFSLQQSRLLTSQEILQDLAQSQVVYLGETHDRAADHQAQLDLIRQLHNKNPRLAIGMEMFQRPFQPILDRYLAGKITEAELRKQSEYDERWGFPWEYYAPILRYARQHRLPVLALNTPAEVTRKVARQGLESLTKEEQQQIPPFTEIHTDNADYRAMLQKIYADSHHGTTNSRSFDRFFLAQVLWDETMAETIAQFVQRRPNYQVVVLAGQGHIVYGYGVPSRVARRIQRSDFRQRTVILNPSQDETGFLAPNIADYLWATTD